MATPKLLDSQCSYCEAKCTGKYCAGCKVVRYCSKEHQTEDWPRHKPQCAVVKKARSAMEREERRSHDNMDENDPFQNGDPFETGVGHFWGLIETRKYMRAKYGYLDGLRKIKTKEAVQVALDQAAKQNNKHFWPAIVDPGCALTARPETYSMGSKEEMELMLQYLYEAWEETPGAVEWVKRRLR
ncbi:hypothetical protein AC579_4174 [Pseudocercospora musae]|uniref:MYND-type domain-containing protein n=1 Tax=Pseudocercospora musae TaxID=113226 RepID=A0A139IFM5_9PEZI|nr:hypothetical protein AC579_4174 [Pseudocercospora musae]